MCPFLDNPDARCDLYLNLKNIHQAFYYCPDCYNSWPVYQQIVGNGHEHDNYQIARLLAS